MSPTVSVILIIHRDLELLVKLLKQIEKQDVEKSDFELVICPSVGCKILEDESLLSVSGYNYKIILPKVVKDYSINNAYKANVGVDSATGSWVTFLADGIDYPTSWLKNAILCAEAWSPDLIKGFTKIQINELLSEESEELIFLKPNVFYKKEFFKSLGGFDKNKFPTSLYEVDLFWSAITQTKKIHEINDLEIYFSSDCKFHFENEASLKLLSKLPSLFLKHPAKSKGLKFQIIKKYYYIYYVQYFLILLSLIVGSIWLVTASISLLMIFHVLKHYTLFAGFGINKLIRVSITMFKLSIASIVVILREVLLGRIDIQDAIELL